MEAAGVEPDEATIERSEAGVAERLGDLAGLLERLDAYSSNPDYLHSKREREASDGGS